MKTATLSKVPAGYGHYKLSVELSGDGTFEVYHTKTNNMRMIDRFNHESYETAEDPQDYLNAIREAVETVLDDHKIKYTAVTVEYDSRYDHRITVE